jgi:nucleotide-binding universal stress UspA family protein
MAQAIETVLIGTTLHPSGDAIVASGIRLARALKARVHLVHACEPALARGGAPFGAGLLEPWDEAERQALAERLESAAARLGLGRAELAGTTLERGAAHRVLLDAAQRCDADLIVIGAAESDAARARLIGATADRVVRKADCPVLLVRRELALPPARVLLPVDLSAAAAEALGQGLALLREIAGENRPEIEALFVGTEVSGRPARGQSVPEAERAAALGRLRDFLGRAPDASLTTAPGAARWRIEPRVEFGLIDRAILDRIERRQPDLVVLRTNSRVGFDPLVLGRVATAVVRQGNANVLLIPPAAARAARGARKGEALAA